MKFYKLAAAAAVVLVSSTVNAALVTYTDRTTFQAAAGTTVTEDFNSEVVGTSFRGAPLSLNGFTLERELGSLDFLISNTAEIEDGAGGFNVNDTNLAMADISPNVGELVLIFDAPIFSFGLDLDSFNVELSAGDPTLRTSIFIDGVIVEDPLLTTVASGSPFRFLGFTSDIEFSSIIFRANDLGVLADSGDSFGIDNIEYGVSTVPVPAAAWLFGSAILGMFGFSRRKTHA